MESTAEERVDTPTPSSTKPSNTKFDFQNKGFSIQGTVFRFNRYTNKSELNLNMGGFMAALEFNDVVRAFSLKPDDPDVALMRTAESALRYVTEVRPGDSIPNEILDGTASWKVEKRHYQAAHSRLLMQLMKWMSEGGAEVTTLSEMLALMEKPEMKEKLNAAFIEAGKRLGLGDKGKEQVADMIEHLAGELAYIEALREKIAGYIAITKKLKALIKAYHGVQNVSGSIERINALIDPVFKAVRDQIRGVEARTSEIGVILGSLRPTINYVRETRDKMRGMVLLWGDLDIEWADVAAERNQFTDSLISKTYRFVASNYLTGHHWSL